MKLQLILSLMITKGSRVITSDKLKYKPSSNIYFENLFNYDDIDWGVIYMLPLLVTHSTYMRSFQYKILYIILCLNKKHHNFGIKSSRLCSLCNLYDETQFHIFYECDLMVGFSPMFSMFLL